MNSSVVCSANKLGVRAIGSGLDLLWTLLIIKSIPCSGGTCSRSSSKMISRGVVTGSGSGGANSGNVGWAMDVVGDIWIGSEDGEAVVVADPGDVGADTGK